MGEGVGHDAALTLLLQAVVTDGVGGVQGFFDIPGFQPVQALLGIVSPDPRQAVGLQLLTYQQATVAFHALTLLASRLDLGGNAEQGLYVVTDLVGDDIRLGKITGGVKTLRHLLEETHVQVHPLIGRAIERTGRR
ncbi:hypothetical protein D3C76_1554180 [compost metagenome]